MRSSAHIKSIYLTYISRERDFFEVRTCNYTFCFECISLHISPHTHKTQPHFTCLVESKSSSRREAVNSNFWNVYTVQTYFLHEFMLVIIIIFASLSISWNRQLKSQQSKRLFFDKFSLLFDDRQQEAMGKFRHCRWWD